MSHFSAAQIHLYQKALDEPIRVNQVELSLRHAGLIEAGVQVNRGVVPADAGAEGLLDSCREHGIDVQAWAPFAQGRAGGSGRSSGARALRGSGPPFQATQVRLSREDWYRLLNTAREGELP